MSDVKNITVYGTGCKSCEQLHANALEAIDRIGSLAKVDYITDIVAIAEAGIMSTPALAIDGQVVSMGKVLNTKTIETLLG